MQLARAIGGITSQGVLRRPHVVFPDEMPAQLKPAAFQESTNVPIDAQNWETITDAMALVPSPAGTAGSAHLEGVDFAGKTGSAQTMSNALAQRLGHKHSMKDNAWFVGVTPRRSPELVVAVLFEGGEHGQFAARIAAAVVKAYVLKQRGRETKVAAAPGLEKTPAASQAVVAAEKAPVPVKEGEQSVEIAGFWGEPDRDAYAGDSMRAARFRIDLKGASVPITAAVVH
jgi:penicillin-binding protein 2